MSMTDVNSNDLIKEDVSPEKVTEEVKEAVTETAETVESTVEEIATTAENTVQTAEMTSEESAEEAAQAAEAATTPTDEEAAKMAEIERLAAEKFAAQKGSKFEYKKEVNIDNKWLNIVGMAAILFLVGAVIIYLMPSKRVSRLITKADEFYAAADYDNAGKTYEKALMIDALSPEAAKGFISSAMAESTDKAGEDFKKVLTGVETIKARNGELKIDEEKVPAWVEVFLLSPEIFRAEEDAKNLAEGYEMLNNPSELKPALANAYYEWGEVLSIGNYEEALACFDKALNYSDYAESYKKEIRNDVSTIIDDLKTADKFDKAYEVLKKYEKSLFAEESDAIRQSIASAEALYNTKISLLSEVYDTLSPYYESVKDTPVKNRVKEDTPLFGFLGENWEKMLMLDGSEDANALAYSFTEPVFNYAKEGFNSNFTGVGCGLYTFGEKYTYDGGEGIPYYFYFGGYKNGKRDGFGITFVKVDVSSYLAFEGEWKDDAPNGFGISYECDMYSYTSLAEYRRATYGEFKNGLENGSMVTIAVLNEHPDTYFKGSYTAENGYVAPVEGDLINYGIVDPVPEGYKLITVLASDVAGYDFSIPLYTTVDALMAVEGF